MRNFFERQDEARRKTTRLVALFALAVGGIIVSTYLALIAVLAWGRGAFDPVQPQLALAVAVAVLVLVGGGSLFKVLALRDGGHVVAESLGGEKLDRDPETPGERRLLNVVEEMAIASGVPVPPVYVLEEEGINAFAAGFTPDDAVISVTRGCVELLDRDELQGVIAHEFSHILNEDMRLNLRLIGLLHGILLVGITGRVLMQSTFYGGGRSRNRDGGKGRLALLALAFALVIIGFVGFFCGRLIKAAVSRQREFLADASAVQFTRNPDGIGGALKKIGGHVQGARVEADKAEEASHLFFGYALGEGFFSSRWLSTHPPLEERVGRIDPEFDGTFPSVSVERMESGTDPHAEGTERQRAAAGAAAASQAVPGQGGDSSGEGASAVSASPDAESVIERAGTVSVDQINRGRELRDDVPTALYQAVHEPLSAVAVAYALLLDDNEAMREHQLRILRHRETRPVVEETERLFLDVAAVPSRIRLPLLDLAAPALRECSEAQRTRLHDTIRALAEADDQLTLFEYALATIVRHRLEHVAQPHAERVQIRRFAEVKSHLAVLLSGLASMGHREARGAKQAFRAGVEALQAQYEGVDMQLRSVSAQTLDAALDRLAVAAPSLKEAVVAACAQCALVDERVTSAEADLLRAVTIALDVPLPPQVTRAAPAEETS